MTCPECEQVMHMDSQGVCSCIACGYQESQNPEITVNDAGETVNVSINDTLKERGSRYGDFKDHASIAKQLRYIMLTNLLTGSSKGYIEPYMEEAIIMITHKLARIANGDPYYDDSWRDIAGYAQLVVDNLQDKE